MGLKARWLGAVAVGECVGVEGMGLGGILTGLIDSLRTPSAVPERAGLDDWRERETEERLERK